MNFLVPMLIAAVACGDHAFTDPDREFGDVVDEDAPLHPVLIHTPTTLGVADTPVHDARGRPVGVACATCHGPEPSRSWAAQDDGPATFHGQVDLKHGTLTCNHCHDATDRTLLHLADGTPVQLTDAMTLCAQCHGVQHRDYQRGSHGGMNGYWDRRRGPRDRNHCVDCHYPHQPAYQQVMPVHPPRDRYLKTGATHQEAH